ncbi:MAG: hypothetical protein GWN99_09765 [Gemmatimonadetes bacterium]|uniref:Uncharacterized protein n=1 Tax=Candidatus Kutchimonas denitrificans TaxID=3056748 RepID=A0AAE4Z5H9_9BACT|nr:hypothetical protein [Gemmatimonadota bacterium]NIR74154.1 hypothetical protein [Candidatus Kutchimonas denitrificans]NIS01336.1 hypothetical protein [Gemmatimonadota bacterium]NIT67067.1 hypothetical protein [Gemmatimonadota bacterium]NIU51727.1 hypothetical protein [Gemmatimonadota bacterium]
MARRSGEGDQQESRKAVSDSEEILRAKYYDYCSARVCDVFMELDEARVFELARAAEERAGVSPGALNFRDLASLLVEQLLGDMSLPDFDSWAEDYKQNPEQYDPYLLGLWKSSVAVDSGR